MIRKISGFVVIAVLVGAITLVALTAFNSGGSKPTKTTVYSTEQACSAFATYIEGKIAGVSITYSKCVRVKADGSAEDTTGKSSTFVAAIKVSSKGTTECDEAAFRAVPGKAPVILDARAAPTGTCPA